MLIRYIILSLFLLTAVADTLAGEVYRFRRIDVDNGLPQSFINTIAQDNDGFLWIGTQDGLVRYDGRNMKVFSLGNAHTLRVVDSVIHVNTGRGWFAYQPAISGFVKSNPTGASAQSQTVARVVDSRGRTWTATRYDGVHVFDPRSQVSLRFSSTQATPHRLPASEITSVVEDQRGRIWVGTNGKGVVVINNLQVDTVLRNDPANVESLSNDVVSALFCDREGIVWIGTHGSGVSAWDPDAHLIRSFTVGSSMRDVKESFVRSVTTDQIGRTIVGTRMGIVLVTNDYRNQQAIAQWPLGSSGFGEVHALFTDVKGQFWIGTERAGLGRLDQRGKISWIKLLDEEGKRFNTVYSISPLTDSTVAIGVPGSIVELNVKSARTSLYAVPAVQANVVNIVRCVQSIGNGRYLLGTEQGLFIGSLKGDWKLLLYPANDGVQPNVNIIRSILIRSDTAFIGTWGGGIRVMDLSTLREYLVDHRHGLPNSTVYVAVPRKDGSIIATTNAGMVVLRAGRVTHHVVREQGAQSNEFNTGAWHITKKGDLLAGGISGVSVVPAGGLPNPRPVARAYLEAVELDGVRLPDSAVAAVSGIHIPNTAAGFAVTVSPILMSQAQPIRYRYALRDSDFAKWTVTNSSTLRFASVAPGDYELVIEMQRGNGPWTRAYTLSVKIEPPWWQTWWAIVTGIGAGLTIAVASTAVVTRQREERKTEREQLLNEERLRIARDLHDEVGSGLARIVVLADAQLREGQAVDTTKIADTARNVMASVRSIARVMKSGEDTFVNTIEYIRDKAEEYFADQSIEFGFEMFSELPDRSLSVLERRNLILSAQEAVTNITKHSQASSVLLSCSEEDDSWVVSFRDNGVGMSHERTADTSGIDNMKTRMHEVGFRFEIRSGPHCGTEVRFILS